jgi:small-conductance mechanosensitive channel
VEPHDYDDIMARLVQLAEQQGGINARLTAAIERQEARLDQHADQLVRLTTIQERQERTQARIETLLARMVRGDTNGRDA